MRVTPITQIGTPLPLVRFCYYRDGGSLYARRNRERGEVRATKNSHNATPGDCTPDIPGTHHLVVSLTAGRLTKSARTVAECVGWSARERVSMRSRPVFFSVPPPTPKISHTD